MEDKKIIRLLQSKPSIGLHEVISKYNAAVHGVVRSILRRNPEDVEECVADTFVQIWKVADRIDPNTDTFRGLLLGTARNLAINRYHQLKRQQVVPLDTFLELVGEEDVAVTVLGEDTTLELQELIKEMGPPDQEIFFRKYFLFDTIQEIAQHLGLDAVQIKNRLYRGRKRLKKELEERGNSSEVV